MPLVTVEDAGPPSTEVIDAMLARVAGAVAAALGRPAADVWARFVVSDGVRFADRARHPIVTVATSAEAADVVERALRAAAEATAASLGIEPEDVWARFDALAPGSVLADGELR